MWSRPAIILLVLAQILALASAQQVLYANGGPYFTSCPSAAIVVQSNSGTGMAVTYNAAALDSINQNMAINCNFPSGATFPLGTTKVTCTAADPALTAIPSTQRWSNARALSVLADTYFNTANLKSVVVTCPSNMGTFSNALVWGCSSKTGINRNFFTGDSAVCASAVHAGLITAAAGGSFRLLAIPALTGISTGKLNSFCAANLNGVPTANWVSSKVFMDSYYIGGFGTSATCSFDVTVRDTVAPTFNNCPGTPVQLSPLDSNGAFLTLPTAKDNADPNPTVSCVYNGQPFTSTTYLPRGGPYTVVCTAQDFSSNSATCSITANVVDISAPVLTCPTSNVDVELQATTGSSVTFPISAIDNVDGAVNPVITYTVAGQSVPFTMGNTLPLGSYPFKAVAKDAVGNTATCQFRVNVADTQAPVLTCPPQVSALVANPAGTNVVLSTISATDSVVGAVPVDCYKKLLSKLIDTSGAIFSSGKTTVYCEASDGKNTGSCEFVVDVLDLQAPVLQCPSSQPIAADSKLGKTITYSVSATDNGALPGDITIQCSMPSGSLFPIGASTVSCVATDLAGNTAGCSFTYTVTDSDGPQFTACPSSIANRPPLQATSSNGAVYAYTTTAVDAVDGSTAVDCGALSSGSTFPLFPLDNLATKSKTTEVSCSSKDSQNNVNYCIFDVVVTDQVAPVLTCPNTNIVFEANSDQGTIVTFTVTAVDNVSGVLASTCVDSGNTVYSSGSRFTVGNTKLTCTSRDKVGNQGSCQFTVSITDISPPQVTCPANKLGTDSLEITSPAGATYAYSAPLVVDNGTPNLQASCNIKSTDAFPLGDNTVTCQAFDSQNSKGTCLFRVNVVDTQPPVITSCPASTTVEAESAQGSYFTYALSYYDNGDSNPSVLCNRNSGDLFSVGSTRVACEVSDKRQNKASCVFTVTVTNSQGPKMFCPASITQSIVQPTGNVVMYNGLNAYDNSGGIGKPIPVTCNPPSGSTFSLGTQLVICSATDSQNPPKTSICRFNVVIIDVEAPQISCPPRQSLSAVDSTGAPLTYTLPTTVDKGDANPQVSCNIPFGTKLPLTFPSSSTCIKCTSRDLSGNANTCSFCVEVIDDIPPVPTCPADMSFPLVDAKGVQVDFTLSAVDNADPNPIVYSTRPSGYYYPTGHHEITVNAFDVSGNIGDCTFSIDIVNTNQPVITCPQNIVEEISAPTGNSVDYSAVATDPIYGAQLVKYSISPKSNFPLGAPVIVVASSYNHPENKVATCSFTVTVLDTIPPYLSSSINNHEFFQANNPKGYFYSVNEPTFLDKGTHANQIKVTCDKTGSIWLPLGIHTITCVAEDGVGLTTTVNWIVDVLDTVAPTLSFPTTTQTLEATSSNGAVATWTVSATDLVNVNPVVKCKDAQGVVVVSGATLPIGTNTIQCTADDQSTNPKPNVATGSFNIIVQDTTPPSFTCPPTVTAEATSYLGTTINVLSFITGISDLVTPANQIKSVCDKDQTFLFTTFAAVKTICTFEDSFNNKASCDIAVSLKDTTNPTIACPGDETHEADSFTGFLWTCPTFSWSNDANKVPRFYDNFANKKDLTSRFQCYETSGPLAQNNGPFALDLTNGNDFDVGVHDISAVIKDTVGNTNDCSFKVTVTDTTAPTFDSCPSDINAGIFGSVATWNAPTASDNRDTSAQITITCDTASGSTFNVPETLVTCTAVDRAGNKKSDCSFKVTAYEDTKLQITCPNDITNVESTTYQGSLVSFSISTLHPQNTNPGVFCDHPSGSMFPIGDTTVTCHANIPIKSVQCSFKVSVVDTTAPNALKCPSNYQFFAHEKLGQTGFVALPQTYDNGVQAVNVKCNVGKAVLKPCDEDEIVADTAKFQNTQFKNQKYFWPLGTTTVDCEGDDNLNNAPVKCSFDVVVEDKDAPLLKCPSSAVAEADCPQGALVPYDVTVEDDVDPNPLVYCTKASGTVLSIGSYTIECEAKDASDNKSKCKFDVKVVDTTAPTLTCPSKLHALANKFYTRKVPYLDNNGVLQFKNNDFSYVNYVLTDFANPVVKAVDAIDGDVDVNCSGDQNSKFLDQNGNVIPVLDNFHFPLGLTRVTCTTKDSQGNKANCAFDVEVVDEVAPVVQCPEEAQSIFVADQPKSAVITIKATIGDAADPHPSFKCSLDNFVTELKDNDRLDIGEYLVTCKGEDASKNAAQCSYPLRVLDNVAPVLTCKDVLVTSAVGVKVNWNVQASDDVWGNVTPQCSMTSGTTFAVGQYDIKCFAVDGSGNVGYCDFKVMVFP